MNNNSVLLGVILAVCALSLSAGAIPQSVFELDEIAEKSDVVILVNVLDVKQTDTTNMLVNGTTFLCHRLIASCKVMEEYKGEVLSDNLQVAVQFLQGKDVWLGMEELTKGETSILFLRKGIGGQLEFSDGRCSKIPIGSFVPGTRRQDDSLRQSIGRQLAANVVDKNLDASENAIYWANRIDYTIPETTLGLLSESTNANMRAVGLVPLVRKRQKAAITNAVDLLLSGEQIGRNRLQALAWAVEGVADCVSVEQANQLAVNDDTMISRIGLRILRTIANESSVPALLAGLDVENADAQYSAVIGLCLVTGSNGPSLWEFMQNRDAEILRWKIWGKEREEKGTVP